MNYPNTLGLPPLPTEEMDRIGARIDDRELTDEDVVKLYDSHVALTDRLAHANQEIAALQDTIAEAERLNVAQEEELDALRGRSVGRIGDNGNLIGHTPRGYSVQHSKNGTFIVTAAARPDDGSHSHLLGLVSFYLRAEDIKYLAAFEHTAAMLTAPVAAQEEA